MLFLTCLGYCMSKVDGSKTQIFCNTGAPVLLEGGYSADIGTKWRCIGVSSDCLVLKPIVPLKGQSEDLVITISPRILELAFTVYEEERIVTQ